MKRRARSCRPRRSREKKPLTRSMVFDTAVPGFPWPPPLLAELREIFRLPLKLVEQPPKADA
jgi:hypothetical protein